MRCLTLLYIIATAGTIWGQQSSSASLTHKPTPGAVHPAALPAGLNAVMITPQEQEEMRVARSEALQANPDLIADNDRLAKRMHDFEQKLDAAMVKADPTVAPLMAKLQAARLHSAAPLPPPTAAALIGTTPTANSPASAK